GGGVTRIYYSRSFDGGDTWETPREISGGNTRDAAEQSISVDTRNRVHIAWHVGNPDVDTVPTEVYYTRSTDSGDTFETPKRLNTGSDHAGFPRFTVQGTMGDLLAIAWRDMRNGHDWDVYVAVSTDSGATFTERFVYDSGRNDWDPEVTVDADGVLHLAYFTDRDGPTNSAIDYGRSTDQGQSWSTPVVLSEASSRFPSWAPDIAHGVLWLFWKDERDFTRVEGCTAQNRCADIAGKYSADGGQTWSEMEFITDLGNVELKLPAFIVGADGRPHVMWSDPRYGLEQEAVFVKSRLAAPVSKAAITDTHVHLDGKYLEAGPGGPSVVTDFDSAAATALAKMDELGIQKSLLMPPPFAPEMINSPLVYDYTDLAAVAQNNPERFGFLGGGGLLNPTIHSVPSDQVTAQIREEFEQTATAIAEAGAAGFGEMTALHLSFFDGHPFLEAPPDHELFLLLADIAASYDMPIDLHMEAVVSDLELSPVYGPPNPQPPDVVHANIDAFERLLSHNPDARIVWAHAGADHTGDMTVELLRQLLEDHPNLYASVKVLERAGLQYPENRPVDGDGTIRPEWLQLMTDFPDRFVMGGDQFYGIPGKTPQRPVSTEWTKRLIDQLPEGLARQVLEDNVRRIYRLDAGAASGDS
ncbi:MAG: exo-alpha-sialidase, partial [Anaerolineae bacterium]